MTPEFDVRAFFTILLNFKCWVTWRKFKKFWTFLSDIQSSINWWIKNHAAGLITRKFQFSEFTTDSVMENIFLLWKFREEKCLVLKRYDVILYWKLWWTGVYDCFKMWREGWVSVWKENFLHFSSIYLLMFAQSTESLFNRILVKYLFP